MTTLTELRQHPVEILAFVNLIALFTGVTLGVLTYIFGPGAHSFTLLNANIALMLFLMTWGHLRHSHIWLSFHGPGRPAVPEPGAPPDPSFDEPRALQQEPRLRAGGVGLGCSARCYIPAKDAGGRRVRRRRDAWRLRHGDAHVRQAVRPFRRAPRATRRAGSRSIRRGREPLSPRLPLTRTSSRRRSAPPPRGADAAAAHWLKRTQARWKQVFWRAIAGSPRHRFSRSGAAGWLAPSEDRAGRPKHGRRTRWRRSASRSFPRARAAPRRGSPPMRAAESDNAATASMRSLRARR